MEERVKKLLDEAARDPNLVLFLDELHTLVGAGGVRGSSVDVGNLFKPALARGALRLIGATTLDEYRLHIEPDAALERRFQPVHVEEPSPAEARLILGGLRDLYQKHHNIVIEDAALDAAVELSLRYLPDRRLPDKARDLIDQAAVNKRFLSFSPGQPPEREPVGREDVARVVAEWTGIPVERLSADRRQRLLELEARLRRRVLGQDEALRAVAEVLRAAFAGLAHPNRPYGVFLFLGPTGVGKTELAKALAESLFDDENRLVRFDMSELMEEHSVAQLLGAPPGYLGHESGGRLVEAVRRTPYCVLLFDEIEKAHPRVLDVFLQLFDEGRLTDARGRRADFTNTVIVMTSNLQPRAKPKLHGFIGGDSAPPEDLRAALAQQLRPELVNRIGRIVPFRALEKSDLRAIIDKLIGAVERRLESRRLRLLLDDAAYDWLVAQCRAQFGARELERAVETALTEPLAHALLEERFATGATLRVRVDGGALALEAT
jgi:ATP-dependent Clp protease ATP-binding subunit ClpC